MTVASISTRKPRPLSHDEQPYAASESHDSFDAIIYFAT